VRWESEGEAPYEAARLRLDCGKALARLGWRSVWNVEEAVKRTIDWYRLERAGGDTAGLVRSQIAEYVQAARAAGRPWAEGPQ
jgi:CDP-glucose 4,6-dehydratase